MSCHLLGGKNSLLIKTIITIFLFNMLCISTTFPQLCWNNMWTFVLQRFLNLYCDYRESGCEWRGAWCELEKHLEKCLYFPIQCKWNNCKKTVPRSTINEHESQCEWRIVKCQYCNVEKPFNSISVSYNHSLNFNFLETSWRRMSWIFDFMFE